MIYNWYHILELTKDCHIHYYLSHVALLGNTYYLLSEAQRGEGPFLVFIFRDLGIFEEYNPVVS